MGENCTGKILAELLEDGRKIKLLADYTYTDPSSTSWLAPTGAVVDGASIPQVLWSFIGGPFEGKYRKASVVHDVACDEKKRDWQAVHRMFYDAILCSGVDPWKAKVMYGAVYACGPRWGPDQGTRYFPCGSSSEMNGEVQRLAAYLQVNPLSVEDVEELQPRDLAQIALLGPPPDLREPAPDDSDWVVAPAPRTRVR
jgi:hypothetical protein